MAEPDVVTGAGANPRRYRSSVGEADAELDQRLSDELDRVNAEATRGTDAARELTVSVHDEAGELVAGMSGWTWGLAAGIGMTWVHTAARGAGLGARLLAEFEEEARTRGCAHVFVTSFTFQAPGFYERHGYRELFRWDDVPVAVPRTCTSARISDASRRHPVDHVVRVPEVSGSAGNQPDRSGVSGV